MPGEFVRESAFRLICIKNDLLLQIVRFRLEKKAGNRYTEIAEILKEDAMDAKNFEIKTTHSQDEFKILAKIEYNTRAGGLRYLFYLGCLILVGVGIFSLVKLGFSISALIMIAVGLLVPFMNVRLVNRLAKLMAKQAGDMEAVLSYAFDEESFSIQDKNGDRSYSCEEIEKVVETEEYFFVYLKSTVCFCLPKKDFRQGDPLDFTNFLRQHGAGCKFFRYPGKLK